VKSQSRRLSEERKYQDADGRLLLAGVLHVLIFDPEYGGSTFPRNVDELLPNYTALHLEDSSLHLIIYVFCAIVYNIQ
jgi:hypothetical protein